MSDDTLGIMESQHQEIDSAQQELDRMQRQIKTVLGLRHAETPNVAETYLRGLYDGVYYAEERVERITQYGPRPRTRDISDDTLSRQLSNVVSEGANGNWGNVRVNLEKALETAEELSDEADADGEEVDNAAQ